MLCFISHFPVNVCDFRKRESLFDSCVSSFLFFHFPFCSLSCHIKNTIAKDARLEAPSQIHANFSSFILRGFFRDDSAPCFQGTGALWTAWWGWNQRSQPDWTAGGDCGVNSETFWVFYQDEWCSSGHCGSCDGERQRRGAVKLFRWPEIPEWRTLCWLFLFVSLWSICIGWLSHITRI